MKFRNTTVPFTRNVRHMSLKDLPHVNDGISLTSTLQGVELEVGESIPIVVSQITNSNFTVKTLLD